MTTLKNQESIYTRAKATADFLKTKITEAPRIAMILGSGLGALGDTLENRIAIDYAEIPGFPVSAVEGHAGQLAFGRLRGVPVVVMQGRAHYYEGWSMDDVTFPVRVFSLLGIKDIVVTNSAGGVNSSYKPGDLMIISDHLNLIGVNPICGPNAAEFGTRFPDMSDAYTAELRAVVRTTAEKLGIAIKEGVYAGVSGPSYETPAEVRMIGILGGDAVGMSTVPEVIVASHCGMRVVGISCITNMAAGLSDQKLTHEEVKVTANQVRESFGALISELVESMAT